MRTAFNDITMYVEMDDVKPRAGAAGLMPLFRSENQMTLKGRPGSGPDDLKIDRISQTRVQLA